MLIGCGDDYMTIEHRIIDSDSKIPLYFYGGVYTEPLMNEYFLKYLEMTKKYNNNFGCHSNGSLLTALEESEGFCSRLIELGDSEIDYYSCSLDAGSVKSHSKTKNIKYLKHIAVIKDQTSWITKQSRERKEL